MGLADASRSVACGLGRFFGATRSVVVSTRRNVKGSLKKLRPRSSTEKIRDVVIDELSRLVGEDSPITGARLEDRLKAITETVLTLQQRIEKLGNRRSVGKADMLKEVNSLTVAESLTNSERDVLVSVFRQNLAIQMPGLADAASSNAGVSRGAQAPHVKKRAGKQVRKLP